MIKMFNMFDISSNWMIILVGILIILVLYFGYKSFNLLKQIKNMDNELKLLKYSSPPNISPDIKPNNIKPNNIKPNNIKPNNIKPNNKKNEEITFNDFEYDISNNIKQLSSISEDDTISSSDTISESDTVSDEDYINNKEEIENYGNNEKEMIIPININSLLQRAIEEQIIPTMMNIPIEKSNITVIEEIKSDNIKSEVSKYSEINNIAPKLEEDKLENVKSEDIKNYTEENLNKKNIIAIKTIAKDLGIKLNDGKKLKNKETLIIEIISKSS